MAYWERELRQMLATFEARNGSSPTAILAWGDAYRRITSDCRNAVRKRSGPVRYRGIDVLRVDAPGDRIVLDGGRMLCEYEE